MTVACVTVVFVTGARRLQVNPSDASALLSLSILKFFSRRFRDPRDQEAIIQASALGWLVTLFCSVQNVRSARSWNMTAVSLLLAVLWGRKAIPGR